MRGFTIGFAHDRQRRFLLGSLDASESLVRENAKTQVFSSALRTNESEVAFPRLFPAKVLTKKLT